MFILNSNSKEEIKFEKRGVVAILLLFTLYKTEEGENPYELFMQYVAAVQLSLKNKKDEVQKEKDLNMDDDDDDDENDEESSDEENEEVTELEVRLSSARAMWSERYPLSEGLDI